MPDKLTFGASIDLTDGFDDATTVAVIQLVDVVSDKHALGDDDGAHVYGGRSTTAFVVRSDHPRYAHVTELLHALLDDARGQQTIYDVTATTSVTTNGWQARYVEGASSVVMADVQVAEHGPLHHVELRDLEACELSTGAFYGAAKGLRDGATLEDVTQGWTDAQRAYLAQFLAKPKPRRQRAPRGDAA